MSAAPPSPRQPRAWVTVFGPGAIIASLTIGSGELIFSSRGGALFGYSLLSTFLVVCVLKWALVFATARHMVLTGCHPFERWADLPGPRGWLPTVFLIFAVICFPVWVAFHAGTVGTLLAAVTGTADGFGGAAHTLWGLGLLALVTWLALSGSYRRLERLQVALVTGMLLLVTVALIGLGPDWGSLLAGFVAVPPSAYPHWIGDYPEIAARPVWLELGTYVGVIGGSGYDYLAYVSFLRSKSWGRSNRGPASDEEILTVARHPGHPDRSWVAAPLMDCTLSFAAVLVFSAVFVACGAEVLRQEQSVPSGGNLLTLQLGFVSHLGSWFEPIYLAGAFLAMFGTLYGTLEVAPATFREGWRVLRGSEGEEPDPARLRSRCLLGTGLAGMGVLVALLVYQLRSPVDRPGLLLALLTPANLFTGVLACGVISWLAVWADRRYLPEPLQMPRVLQGVLGVGGALFFILGVDAYAGFGPGKALVLFAGTVAAGMLVAAWRGRGRRGLR